MSTSASSMGAICTARDIACISSGVSPIIPNRCFTCCISADIIGVCILKSKITKNRTIKSMIIRFFKIVSQFEVVKDCCWNYKTTILLAIVRRSIVNNFFINGSPQCVMSFIVSVACMQPIMPGSVPITPLVC